MVVTSDADGEFPAEAPPALVGPIERGEVDMVQGAGNVIPRLSERFLNWLANRAEPVGNSGRGVRALRRELAQQLEIRGVCICGVLSREARTRGGRIAEVLVSVEHITKHRRIVWYHLRQVFHLLPWLVKRPTTNDQRPTTNTFVLRPSSVSTR